MSILHAILLSAALSPTAMPKISPEVMAIVKEMGEASSPDTIAKLDKLSGQDDSARMLLGEIYFGGMFNTRIDEERACNYFEPLAAKYGEGAHNFATCHFKGVGTRKWLTGQANPPPIAVVAAL